MLALSDWRSCLYCSLLAYLHLKTVPNVTHGKTSVFICLIHERHWVSFLPGFCSLSNTSFIIKKWALYNFFIVFCFSLWACLNFAGTLKIMAARWRFFFCPIWLCAADLSWSFAQLHRKWVISGPWRPKSSTCVLLVIDSPVSGLASDLLCLSQLFVAIKSLGPPWYVRYIWERRERVFHPHPPFFS